MIKFKSSIFESKWQVLTPTIFPDGTSQIWKLNLDAHGYSNTQYDIQWNFENEAELIHLLQLHDLLRQYGRIENIYIPYFPYARQDKEVSNDTTFAKETFITMIFRLGLGKITTYDIHSNSNHLIQSLKPTHFLEVIRENKPDVLFFPDKGALDRYSKLFIEDQEFQCIAKAYGEKVRDQSTGAITGYEVKDPAHVLTFSRVLILDDLIDGGATFTIAAKHLKEAGARDVDLCVSHGIFSKGRSHLHENGIRNIYCTDSLKQTTDCGVYKV